MSILAIVLAAVGGYGIAAGRASTWKRRALAAESESRNASRQIRTHYQSFLGHRPLGSCVEGRVEYAELSELAPSVTTEEER